MLIYLSPKDMAHILSTHLFNSSLQGEAKIEMDFGIKDGQIVAVAAVGEELPKLTTVAELTAPRTSGSVVADSQQTSDEDDSEEDDDNQEPNADGSPKPKRKRRTKAEIEADRIKEAEAAAAANTAAPSEDKSSEGDAPVVEANSAEATATVSPTAEVEPNEADNTPPFDVDEGANLRAEAELLPDAQAPVDTTEATSEPAEADPFADLSVSQEGDELFAQPDVAVTQVTEKADGFVKPTEPEAEDPFANFN